MALEITTVGAKVAYCIETTAGTRPTTGYTELKDVNEAPEFDLSLETIDASNITDTITRYVPGRQDPGGDASFTMNHTNAMITQWKAMVTAADTAYAAGKLCWFAYIFPDAADAFFWAGRPRDLGSSGIQQNSLNTVPGHVAVNKIEGWQTKPTVTTA